MPKTNTLKKIFTACFFTVAVLTQTIILYGFYLSVPEIKDATFQLKDGESAEGSFTISNKNDNKESIKLYGADAIPSGASFFAAKSDTDKQLNAGNWIHFEKDTFDVGPGETKTITFKVTIPETTPPGSYAGAVAVGLIKPQGKEVSGGMTLSTTQRTIFPVYIIIPGVESNSYEWKDFSVVPGKNPLLNISFANTGNTILALEGKIIIKNADDDKIVQTQEIKNAVIYQNGTTNISMAFDNNLAKNIINKYKASAVLDINKVNILTGKNDRINTITKNATFEIDHLEIIYYPVIILVILLVIIIAVILRKRMVKANAKKYTVTGNETLEEIAKKTKVSWGKIARLNNIRPPYTLKSGMIILIPKS